MLRQRKFPLINAGILVVQAIALCLVSVSLWHDRARALEDGLEDARNITAVVGGQISRLIQSVDIVLHTMQHQVEESLARADGSPTDERAKLSIDAITREPLALLPQALHLSWANRNGDVVASTVPWPAATSNVRDRRYFAAFADVHDDRLVISSVRKNRLTGKDIVVFSRPLHGPDRSFAGVAFLSVEVRYFEDILRDSLTMPDQIVALLCRAGVLYTTQFRDADGISASSPLPVGEFGRPGRQRIEYQLPDYPLVIAASISEEVLLREWHRRAVLTAGITIACFACALYLLRIMARQFQDLSASEATITATALKLDAALNNMSHGLVMFGHDERLIFCNERYREILRLAPNVVSPGCALREIVTLARATCGFPLDIDACRLRVHAIAATRTSMGFVFTDTSKRVIAVKTRAIWNGGWVSTLDDVTDRHESEARIERLTLRDQLTGLANRFQLVKHVHKVCDDVRESGRPFDLLMIDLFQFRDINDTHGHATGDQLLKETARRLQLSIGDDGMVARIGGDEFAVVRMAAPTCVSDPFVASARSGIVDFCERILASIAEPYDVDGQSLVVGASIGIVTAPHDGNEPDDLLKKADLALFNARSKGRAGYAFFDQELAETLSRRKQLEADLHAALRRNEFELHYQPLVQVSTRRICGMEALVRWRHPRLGLIGPDHFIELAETTGLIGELGEWILRNACNEAARWPSDIGVAVNISPVQFQGTPLVDVILQALRESGLAPSRLEIEITEGVLLSCESDHFSALHSLKKLGISIAVDDFGTGYSSMSYLTMFPFDKIKIDRSFTREMLDRSDCAAIVAAVVNLGRSLDIVTLAEGVETQAQFDALHAAGVMQVQGYLFSRPVPAERLATLLQNSACREEFDARRQDGDAA